MENKRKPGRNQDGRNKERKEEWMIEKKQRMKVRKNEGQKRMKERREEMLVL